jgi:hypothetical protein
MDNRPPLSPHTRLKEYDELSAPHNFANIILRPRPIDRRDLTGSELGALAEAGIHKVDDILHQIISALPKRCYKEAHRAIQDHQNNLAVPDPGEALDSSLVSYNLQYLIMQKAETFPVGEEAITHSGKCRSEHDVDALAAAQRRCGEVRGILKRLQEHGSRMGMASICFILVGKGYDKEGGDRTILTNSIMSRLDDHGNDDKPSSYEWDWVKSVIKPAFTDSEVSGRQNSEDLLRYKPGCERVLREFIQKTRCRKSIFESFSANLSDEQNMFASTQRPRELASMRDAVTAILRTWDTTVSGDPTESGDDTSAAASAAANSRTSILTKRTRNSPPNSTAPSSSANASVPPSDGNEPKRFKRRQ